MIHTFRFPLHKKSAVMPCAMVTSDATHGKLIFPDGKSCDINLHSVYSVPVNTSGLNQSLVVPSFGNAIVADGNDWYQVSYKMTSKKS